eukprot:1155629-Prymnesium_polylepis.1
MIAFLSSAARRALAMRWCADVAPHYTCARHMRDTQGMLRDTRIAIRDACYAWRVMRYPLCKRANSVARGPCPARVLPI